MKAPYDYIVAADVVYKEELFAPLIDTLKTLSDNDTVIYLAYKQRSGMIRGIVIIVMLTIVCHKNT